MTNQMMQSQVGFVRNYGTHVKIKSNGIGKLKFKFKPRALLFIDFKSAYNTIMLIWICSSLI